MLRFTPDGEFVDIYATGLRNSAGFDWSPATGGLYATDNGRDLLGDDFPPCELNEIVEGGSYGWPFANAARIPDPDFGEGNQAAIEASLPPAHEFRPHNAPLGMVFLRHRRHAPDYHHAAVVALHGSWNRREKDGYKVVSLHFGPDGRVEERDFLSGFLVDGAAIGRPVDVAEGPDGSVYVSDDFGSAIYRITYGAEGGAALTTTTMSTDATSVGYDPASVTTEVRDAALAGGAEVFAGAECAVCHAAAADGGPAQVPLADLAPRYTVDELAEYLATPQPPMPPFEADLAARRALAIYLLETY